MPWKNPVIDSMIEDAKILVSTLYPVMSLTAEVFVTTRAELLVEAIKEKQSEGGTEKELVDINLWIDYTDGKYFKYKHEIWLIQDDGEKLGTIIHEFLHSIQKCHTNRERIVEYLTYKLTNDPKELVRARLREWQEIERTVGINGIRDQLLRDENCEEF